MAAALHNKLLTDIVSEMETDSPEYQSFVFHMTQFVPKGILNSKPTMLAKFDAMKSKGKLDIGKYDCLTKVAKLSENNDVVELIKQRETEIIEALKREKTGQNSDLPQSSGVKRKTISGTDAIITKKRQLDEETDHADPLYGVDSKGKGKYDTAGKKGYLLILNNTYKRLGTGSDVAKLQSFFGEELNFEVNTITEDLSWETVMEELRKAREKLNNDTQRTYYAFFCAMLTHGGKNGLELTNNGVITVDEIRKFFCEDMHNFAGRPKLFLIQSCRGSEAQDLHPVDDADEIKADDIVDESDEIIYIPSDADTLLACSSTEGYASYRKKKQNTCFIDALHEIFSTCYRTDHVEDMLISIREKIALLDEPVYDNDKNVWTRQMPCTLSTLTKRLYLTAYTGQL